MIFSDLALARRAERAEGEACRQFAVARRKLLPDCGSDWIECGGAYVVFDGVDSPVTQTFGLGIFEPMTTQTLDVIEKFFHDRGAPVQHEVSPLAGVAALSLLCERGYKPMEISSVLYRGVENPPPGEIKVKLIDSETAQTWADISASGWGMEAMRDFSAIITAKQNSHCFLAELDGVPGAAGALNIHDGVALFAGASTVPEMRRRGLQGALLQERMRYAFEHNCDLAIMVAEAGGESQRNAERKGFRIAYTRTKWHLA